MGRFSDLIFDMGRLWSKYSGMYFAGIRNTLILATAATVIGCLIGLICGILNTIPYSKSDNIIKRFFLRLIRIVVRVYVEVFRGTPMMLQAVFIYYDIPYFTYGAFKFVGNTGMWAAALIIVSINTGAYMAESVRGGIISIDPGQTEGAKAIGMNHFQTMLHVILPQAVRNIVPQIGNNYIINIKDTSIMFIIGFSEFFAAHRNIVGINLMYFQSSAIEMIGYLTLTLTASFILRWVERAMDGSDNYELASNDSLTMSAGTYNYPAKDEPFSERSVDYAQRVEEEERERIRQNLKYGGGGRGER